MEKHLGSLWYKIQLRSFQTKIKRHVRDIVCRTGSVITTLCVMSSLLLKTSFTFAPAFTCIRFLSYFNPGLVDKLITWSGLPQSAGIFNTRLPDKAFVAVAGLRLPSPSHDSSSPPHSVSTSLSLLPADNSACNSPRYEAVIFHWPR